MNFFKRKKKKTELEIENELTSEIINSNINSIKARVIQYVATDIELPPDINYICDFTLDIMPDINSIIWCPDNKKNKLIPYKVIRYDFIIDTDSDAGSYVYIVVDTASLTDISKNIYGIY